MTSLLACEQLSLHRADRWLVRDLSLTFELGQSWMLLGENGAGKSTLLSALAGWQAPQVGHVLLNRQALRQMPPRQRARQLAWLAQQDEYPFPETVMERALSGRYPYQSRWQMDSDTDRDLARQVLAQLDLLPLANRDIAQLSGGERRRASLAAVLVQDTDILLLDEPMSQLDIRHQSQLLTIFQDLRARGKTLIVVGHDPNHALTFASHVLLLFPNGEWLAGPRERVLTEANLSRLYQTHLKRWQQAGQDWFVPCR